MFDNEMLEVQSTRETLFLRLKCVCVCVCLRACACVFARACVCVCVCVCVRARRAPSFGRVQTIKYTHNKWYICQFVYLCSCSYSILSYVYKIQKMPAHCCIYKLMFYIYLMKYLFNISEYKAMLIKLLIYHRNC